jgi:NAD(P)-dependent dehydrogenase (short-subunit alcohol dehydrogenase family)
MASKKRAKRDSWSPPDLKGQVAVVTGASRGAGRAIAEVLGEAGVTVYVTGRSVRGSATTDGVPGTVEETAEQVRARGGAGIAVRCDHTKDDEVQALFERVQKEQKRLDILVNNVWGGYEAPGLVPASFWKAPLRLWDKMFVAGLRAHLVASYFAIPLMLPHRRGLIVSTVAWDRDRYLGSFYDISKHAIVRMIFGLARELRKHNIAAVAVAPGFMRTERVLKAYQTDEQHWRKIPALAKSESPAYTGRAIARLAADPRRLGKSGRAFRAGDLARQYGITDVDGRRVPPFSVRLSFEKLLEEFEKKAPGWRSRA